MGISVDKILWKDGHITTMASEEAYHRSFSENNTWYMKYAGSEFIWKANMWMEL